MRRAIDHCILGSAMLFTRNSLFTLTLLLLTSTNATPEEHLTDAESRQISTAISLIKRLHIRPPDNEAMLGACIEGMVKRGNPRDAYISRDEITRWQNQSTATPSRHKASTPLLNIKWPEPGYVHIRLASLGDETGAVLARELLNIEQRNPAKGIILDLRNNTGGTLRAAIAVSAIFLPLNSPIIDVTDRDPEFNRSYHASPTDYLPNQSNRRTKDDIARVPVRIKSVPMTILVDGSTASGAEIIAHALKNNQRAIILGQHTAGHHGIQRIELMANGSALKITTGQWHVPNPQRTDDSPIHPDILITQHSDSKDDVLEEALIQLKALGTSVNSSAAQIQTVPKPDHE